jgi:outer membrane protein OmpA-like peptidoglycan-associated protein
MNSFIFRFILIPITAIFIPVFAQPVSIASVEQIVDQLAPSDQPRKRSLRNLKPEPRSIDLMIQFDYDSSVLQEDSKPLLDNLIAAMKTERLKNLRFNVEGHTDAKGSKPYNQNLSFQRADSVMNYMAGKGIPKERLVVIGKGFSELLYPEKPNAMENRRVRITTL